MDEHEWLTSEDPQRMLAYLSVGSTMRHRMASDRKLRMWCIACNWARSSRAGLADNWEERGHSNLSDVEWALDWARPDSEMVTHVGPHWSQSVRANILRCIIGNPYRPVKVEPQWLTPTVVSLATAAYLEREAVGREACRGEGGRWDNEAIDQWYRCQPCHGTGRIETGQLDPVRLAVLADALEEAGCHGVCWYCKGKGCIHRGDTKHIPRPARDGWNGCDHGRVPHPLLEHLRDPGPHYRGDWAVDLLTGKE